MVSLWCSLVFVAQFSIVRAFDSLAKPDYRSVSCKRTNCQEYGSCMDCDFPEDCSYGDSVTVTCTLNSSCLTAVGSPASSSVSTNRTTCRYCWQTHSWEHSCDRSRNRTCSVTKDGAHNPIIAPCRVYEHVICNGSRSFYKRVPCNWTSGHKWSTAFIFSLTLGGFGADRFYLGHWKAGIGKLFSFGGLGVWTLIDVVLIGTGYVGPGDGSVYIY